MNIQIMGTKKNQDTRKAERWFKERNISFQTRHLDEKGISPRELEGVIRAVGVDELIDSSGKAYKDRGLAWMDYDPAEEILENPLLMKLPVVRNGSQATAGYAPEVWKTWE